MQYDCWYVAFATGIDRKMLVRIDTKLEWQIARDPSSNRWVGVCRPLAITAEGETWAELASILFQRSSANFWLISIEMANWLNFCKIAVGNR